MQLEWKNVMKNIQFIENENGCNAMQTTAIEVDKTKTISTKHTLDPSRIY